jgi:hypothetical protein
LSAAIALGIELLLGNIDIHGDIVRPQTMAAS